MIPDKRANMKKVYLSICIILLGISTNAQQLITVPNDSVEISGMPDDDFAPFDAHIEVYNNSNSPITITWGLETSNAPQQWGLGLCDNNNCYDLLNNAGPYTSLQVPAHDTMDMKLQYTSHCVVGTGNARVYAYVTGDSANTVIKLQYKMNLAACLTSVAEVKPVELKIYPNPSHGTFVVSGIEDAGNLSFEVYDVQGALVKSEMKSASNARMEISIPTLPQGSYVLRAFNEQGRVVGAAWLNKIY
jgi:hypothetical protein